MQKIARSPFGHGFSFRYAPEFSASMDVTPRSRPLGSRPWHNFINLCQHNSEGWIRRLSHYRSRCSRCISGWVHMFANDFLLFKDGIPTVFQGKSRAAFRKSNLYANKWQMQWWCRIPYPETNSSPLKIGLPSKWKDHLPTIQLSGALAPSFRECIS